MLLLLLWRCIVTADRDVLLLFFFFIFAKRCVAYYEDMFHDMYHELVILTTTILQE